jgi:hypothetical protein
MTITMHDDFDGDVTIDMGTRDGEMYRAGGMICSIAPWACTGCPITLKICICPDGDILIRSWDWNGDANQYLHTSDNPADVNVTPTMRETVAGLFSGRIKINGIKIPVGESVQDICPIDLAAEEKRINSKIYLA